MSEAALAPPWHHPSRRPYRFAVLLFAGFMIYGSYFAYDSIGAIEAALIAERGIGPSQIGVLYGIYSLGPIFLLFAAGLLVDRIGTRRASLLFSTLITVGAAIVAAAPTVGPMYAGRLLFGYGSEALLVAQNAILARWFRGKELAFAFGVALTISRLGTLFSFNTEALIADRLGPSAALWIAAGLCLASMLANALYAVLDKHAEPALQLADEHAGDRIVAGQVRHLGPSFWWVTALCVTFYSAIFPFTALAPNFFRERFGLPAAVGGDGGFFHDVFVNFLHMFSTAPGTSSIIIFASMVFAPFAGALIDRFGRRSQLMILGALLMIPCYLALGFTSLPPRYPMIALGAAFVLVPAAMWPSIPRIVDRRFVGTAYGVMTQVQNVGLFVFPILNGRLREATDGYQASMVMFAGLGALGLVFAVALARADRRAGGPLAGPEQAARD
jgi:MFS family permease